MYLLLMFGFYSDASEKKTASAVIWIVLRNAITWGLQYYAYIGILEQASNSATGSASSKDLVGGIHLDLLGLTSLVQFLSVLHTPKWFYVLTVVPIYALWSLYSLYKGGASGLLGAGAAGAAPGTAVDTSSSTTATGKNDKRERRAQKRANKWN